MLNKIKNICCIGAGYVGGPTMSVIAEKCPDIQVNVVDINEERINLWNDSDLNKLPIFEPGLDNIVGKCRNKNLHFSTDLKHHIEQADMIFISVNTPTKLKGVGAGKAIDLKYVESSARLISKYASGETIVVEKSTLPVKTAQTIRSILKNSNSDKANQQKFYVLSNPEFLAEGCAIENLCFPDRVLIGGEEEYAMEKLIGIYSKWVSKEKIITTDLWSSELSKLTANAFLAQRISSINSISALCESAGADIQAVKLAIGSDKRIGKEFLNASPGFGGSCFKKDILNLVYLCNHYGLAEVADYWQQIININSWQQKRIANLIVQKLFGTVSEKKIAILGFAFKADTNDTRESPSISVCKELIEEGANLYIFDPKVSESQIEDELGIPPFKNPKEFFFNGSWTYSDSVSQSIDKADAVVILTEWNDFRSLDWSVYSKTMRSPAWLFDTRSVSNYEEAKKHGLNIWRVGLGKL